MLYKQYWYGVMVLVTALSSPCFATPPEDVQFAQWQHTFKEQMVVQAERLTPETFTEAFVAKYELLRSNGVPHCRISFVGMSEFRSWLTQFARKDFDLYLAALLKEFTPEQQQVMKQRCLNRQAPFISLEYLDPLAAIHTPKARLALDPTRDDLTYASLRETLVHEYTHYLVQGHLYNQYVPLKEGMTEYLTHRVAARCKWGLHYKKAYPDEVYITGLLLQHGNGRLKDWFVSHNLSNYELFDVLVTQLAAEQGPTQQLVAEEVVRNLQGLVDSEAPKNYNARASIESLLARSKPRPIPAPNLATAR